MGNALHWFFDILVLDQGPQFTITKWLNLAQAAGIKIHNFGLESRNAINTGERYHAYIRRFCERVHFDALALSRKIVLTLDVKAENDTSGPAGSTINIGIWGCT